MSKGLVTLAGVLLLVGILSGCVSQIGDGKKVRDLEYTVVPQADIPEELKEMLEEERERPMRFFYTTEGYTYIIIGYGEQKTSGYSIQIDELYETEEEVIVKSTLLGPKKDEETKETKTYPYLVLKTEENEKDMVFQ